MQRSFLLIAVPLLLMASTAVTADDGAGVEVSLDAPTVDIPITSFGNRPVVQVRLNGSGPYDFILDTGAASTLIDAALAETLGLPVEGHTQVATPALGTPVPATISHLARLELPGVTVADLAVTAVDLGDLLGRASAPVGILASTLFRDYLLTIDYPGQRMVLSEGSLPEPDGVHVLDFQDDDGLPAIPVRFDRDIFNMHIDTGSPGALTLPLSAQHTISLSSRPVRIGLARTLDREMPVMAAPYNGEVMVGPITLKNPRLTFLEGIEVGNIGYEILGRLSLTLDRANHRLSLQESLRAPAVPSTAVRLQNPPKQRRYGMAFPGLSGDRLEVAHVDAGSPAEGAGLRVGDTVISMNGKPLPELGTEERIQALQSSPLRLDVVRDGKNLVLTMSLDDP